MQITRLVISTGIGLVAAFAVLSALKPADEAPLAPTHAAPAQSLSENLTTTELAALKSNFGPLADMVGTTWRGEPADTSTDSSADIQSWGSDLGGAVLVIRHAIENGTYGGISYVYRNAETGRLDYVYITNAGFHTSGSFDVAPDGSWSAEEAVTGQGEITRVRSTGRRLQDGTMDSKADYFKNGEWVPGHHFIYHKTDAAVPSLKPPVRPSSE